MKMKSLLLLIAITVFSSSLIYAQRQPGASVGVVKTNWYKKGKFLDGNIGARFMGATSEHAEMSTGLALSGSFGYIINEFVGVKGRMDYLGFKVTPGYNDVSNSLYSISASAEGFARLLQIIGGPVARDYGLNFHAGVGITSLFNPAYRDYVKQEYDKDLDGPFFKNADDMFHVILGINPQFHINSKFSINLDLSHFIQFKQHRTYDTFNKETVDGPTGVMAFSLGLTMRL